MNRSKRNQQRWVEEILSLFNRVIYYFVDMCWIAAYENEKKGKNMRKMNSAIINSKLTEQDQKGIILYQTCSI